MAIRISSGITDYNANMFGAIGDGVTNDAAAIQKAVDFLYSIGGGVLNFDAKTYIVNSAISLKPNVEIRGAGMYATVLKVGVDNISLLSPHVLTRSGVGAVRDITLWGYGDRNTAGGGANKLAQLGPFDQVLYTNVRAIYSRNMSLTANATIAEAHGCFIKLSARDGISFTDSTYVRVQDNTIEECADDAIACHVKSSTAGIFDKAVIITGNRFYKSYGIKALGARNCIISNNVGRFWYNYACYVAYDAAEGVDTKFNIVIEGNTFTDGIPGNLVGSTNVGTGIFLSGSRSLGGGATPITTYIEQYDLTNNVFQVPSPYVNEFGANIPRGQNTNISIYGNQINQTLEGMTVFSDAGYGTLFDKNGPVDDPAVTTLIRQVEAINFSNGDYENVSVFGNNIYGCSNGVRVKPNAVVRNFKIMNNTMFRMSIGVIVDLAATLNIELEIEGNNFNIDPLFESADRGLTGGKFDGTWTSTTNNNYYGVTCNSARGVVLRNNSFRNCRRDFIAAGGLVTSIDNKMFYDWSVSNPSFKGIGLVNQVYSNKHYYQVSDPTAVLYGQYGATADSAFVSSASAQPATGYFVRGQFVANSNAAVAAGKVTTGWLRLTTNNDNVANTDWAAQVVPNS